MASKNVDREGESVSTLQADFNSEDDGGSLTDETARCVTKTTATRCSEAMATFVVAICSSSLHPYTLSLSHADKVLSVCDFHIFGVFSLSLASAAVALLLKTVSEQLTKKVRVALLLQGYKGNRLNYGSLIWEILQSLWILKHQN
ncbi:unnamed protein product [Ceratitis capitata]|uniref:(Mediterranean fruit fly) hypothetical protein n=1 Tax=Ceratitis capitata TaxID=7213 RepID=A0A811V5N5_CERCA|nr:unnamed protein product [Ceratitis capitata]